MEVCFAMQILYWTYPEEEKWRSRLGVIVVWCSRAKSHCVCRWKFLVDVHSVPQMLYWTHLDEENREIESV